MNSVPGSMNNRVAKDVWLPVPKEEHEFETRFTRHKDETDELNGRLGPVYTKTEFKFPGSGQRSFLKQKNSYRSKTKRYRAPNPFGLDVISGDFIYCFFGSPVYPDVPNTYAHTATNGGRSIDALASNKALSQFVDRLRDLQSASVATTLAEWRQAESMLVARATQLSEGLRALRRGDFKKLNKLFKAPKGFRAKAKGGANMWLEYHFGWSPLVQDIYNAVQVLSAVPPSQKVRGRGRSSEPILVRNAPIGATTYIQEDLTYSCRVECGAEMFTSNPNTALANQMGFINPAAVAWELVPFSFLVDWFLPVGDFLNSFTDLLGHSVHYPYTTTKRSAIGLYRYADGRFITDTWLSAANLGRVLGLPSYKLRTTPFKGLSLSRGATAISLVIQQFLQVKH